MSIKEQSEAIIKDTIANVSEARRIVEDLWSSGTEAKIIEVTNRSVFLEWNDGVYDIQVTLYKVTPEDDITD